MVRTYRRRYTNARKSKNFRPYLSYSEQDLQNALKAVERGMSYQKASKEFKVPAATIGRKVRGDNKIQPVAGHPQLFNQEEELAFVHHVTVMGEWGFPCDKMDLRFIAKRYLDKRGRKVSILTNNMSGTDWALNFMKRHKNELSSRYCSNISTKRSAVSGEVIDSFFHNYTSEIQGISADCIVNYDETNVTDDPRAKKCIFKRGCKYPERILNATKTSISIMYAWAADGTLLPPYVVYRSEHLWDTWKEGGPPAARYNRSKRGWFDFVCFEDWFHTIIVPYFRTKPGKKALIGDNLSSHFSKSIIETCEQMDIHFICLPANSTHLMQPLDVAFYAPLKRYWRDILSSWKKSEGLRVNTLSKDSFPRLLLKLQNKLEQENKGSANIISGFRKTGLYPVDPQKPKERLPRLIKTDDTINSSVSEVVIDILANLRKDAAPTATRRRRKRIEIPAGKSVSAGDFGEPSTTQGTTGKIQKNNKCLDTDDDDTTTEDEFVNSSSEDTLPSDNESICSQKDVPKNGKLSCEIPLLNPQIGNWILVKYLGKKMERHYVGQIYEVSDNSGNQIYKVKFLKTNAGKQILFVETGKDEDYITRDMILKILGNPTQKGTDKRCFLEFPEEDFSRCHW